MYRYLTVILSFLVILSCASQKRAKEGEVVEIILGHGRKAEMNNVLQNNARPVKGEMFTDSTHIKQLVYYLSSDEMKGRETGSLEIDYAAEFLEKLFVQNELRPYFSGYRDTLLNSKTTACNIVGFLPGQDPELRKEYILIGAHYDHIGLVNVINGDSIANGANDNASGTATVLELSRYFGKGKTNKRSLIFALFSAEEKGLLGSRHLAQRLKAEGVNLYLMLNFEMTGVPMKTEDYLMYITGYAKSNLAEIANSLVSDEPIGYLPDEDKFNVFERSDNFPFYGNFKIPSHTFCTFDFSNYPHYHRATDEPEELDYKHMSGLINKMIPIIEGLTNSPGQTVKLK
ncbi:M28 family metallopeptidase [Lentiprolixibacter aurantiacus]|uniref:M28 family peptidase n=1 Tax=Lentiprolixibacter aurantiacus TaxID=2993939 RepID=A0AAE3SPJ6_9FLAO|nr:M28 family peptidase [Lentiprolixibacter aurantiacus]MCX2720734.1 M28 family peptidase [Lentiprolixibacter aurantiacus]